MANRRSFWNHRRILEIEGILVLLVSALVLLSLLTFSPADPSFNSTGMAPDAAVRNRAGTFGSYLADLLLQFFGLPSILLPLVGVYGGIRLLLHRQMPRVAVRIVGVLMMICVLSATIGLVTPGWTYRSLASGGWLGVGLGSLLDTRFSLQGGILVCIAGAFIASLLLTPLPFAELIKHAGAFVSIRARGLGEYLRRFRDRRDREKLRKEAIAKHTGPKPAATLSLDFAASEEAGAAGKSGRQAKSGPGTPNQPVQEELPFPEETRKRATSQKLPPISLLDNPPQDNAVDEKELQAKAKLIESKCSEFGIGGQVTEMHPGPVITTYEYLPEAGVKFSRLQSLADDLSLALKAEAVRVTKVPGRSTVGIEVPNIKRERICLRDIIASQQFQRSPSPLTLALGKLSTGEAYMADLARMPHLLIAGATGMGKSVSLNAMICSLVYKSSPAEVRLILVDPKRVELAIYQDIPHLYCEVITEAKQAVTALKNAKLEMDKRYRTFQRHGTRNIDQYNQKAKSGELVAHGDEKPAPLPYLVIIIDELADLMAEMSMEVEHQIGRLAQMARAVGIHLILATQRPSVDVITGTIKNNLPARISFRVSQKIDSRTILDTTGADQLLGNGDMLYLAPGTSRLVRIHGSYVTEEEIMRVVAHLKREGRPSYNHAFLKEPAAEGAAAPGEVQDEMFRQAVALVLSSGQASASHLQRRLKLGYNRAARLIDLMEEQGIVGPASGPNKSREILVKPDFLETLAGGELPEE